MQKCKNKITTMCFLKRNLQNTCAGYNLWVENRFETIAFKHTRDYFDSLDGELYQVGYYRNEKGQEIDIVVQENATDLQYIEAKHRNTSVIKDTDGIVVFSIGDDIHLSDRQKYSTIDCTDINDLHQRIRRLFRMWSGSSYR